MDLSKKQYISLSSLSNEDGVYTVLCPCGQRHRHSENSNKPFLRVSHCDLHITYWVVPTKEINEQSTI